MPSAKNTPMPTPMPASWLRATVAIANPSAAFIASASPARPNSSGSRQQRVRVAHAVEAPAQERAPSAAITTPTRNAAQEPDDHEHRDRGVVRDACTGSGSRRGRPPP